MDENSKENIENDALSLDLSITDYHSINRSKRSFIDKYDFSKKHKYFDKKKQIEYDDSCFNMTLPSGITIKLKKQEIIYKRESSCILSEPFHDIMKKVFDFNSNNDAKTENKDEIDDINIIMQSESQSLWVDKYAPNCFMDLLSDDFGNRMLLKWLKLWDHIVFNKPLPPKSKFIPHDPDVKQKIPFENTITINSEGQPNYRTVILHGNPGSGKTTLAKIVAKHCGYEFVEVNSSCDRTTAAFQQILHGCTEMLSTINKAKKPICLILDEIDGVPLASIDVLLSYLNPNKKGKSLKRPIICICNNMYVPSLKKLLPFCLKISLSQIPPFRLVNRLSQILKEEKVKYEEQSLYVLCDKLECDMRHCINNLQFLSCRTSHINIKDVIKLEKTIYSTNDNYFQSMEEIFKIPSPDKLKINENQDESYSLARFKYILDISHKTNDLDHFLIGLFQNYLSTSERSFSINSAARCTEYFEYSSIINHFIQNTQNYQLMTYQFLVPVFLNFKCANYSQRNSLSFPKSFYDYLATAKCVKHDLKAVNRTQNRKNNQLYSRSDLLMLIFPYLYSIIINHDIRPLSYRGYNSKELISFNNIIDLLTSFSINIESSVAVNYNINTLKFTPDIYEIISFSGLPKLRLPHSVLLQNIKDKLSIFSYKITQTNVALAPKENAVASNRLNVKNHDVCYDFFGRKIVIDTPAIIKSTQDTISETFVNRNILFRYHEGCTDSIKRDVKIKSFIKH